MDCGAVERLRHMGFRWDFDSRTFVGRNWRCGSETGGCRGFSGRHEARAFRLHFRDTYGYLRYVLILLRKTMHGVDLSANESRLSIYVVGENEGSKPNRHGYRYIPYVYMHEHQTCLC
jgi:hypothetical protein